MYKSIIPKTEKLTFQFYCAVAATALMVAGCEKKKSEEPAGTAPTAGASVEPETREKILLGHVNSLTGNDATLGVSSDNGMRLAIEEQNKKGGIKGKQVELKTLDDQGKPEEAAVAATRLVTQDKVMILLGETASSRSLAMAPIADQYKVPMISPTSTNPRVTKDGAKTRPYIFRVCFIDPFQGTVMAKFARETLNISKVAVLRDVGNDYSVGLAQFFSEKFVALGGTIVGDQNYKAGDADFKAQLIAIKSKGPEAIFLPGYYNDVALISRQARELGMKQAFLGGDTWDSSKLYEISKGALDGSYFSNHYVSEDPSPAIQDFVSKYKATYGSSPDAFAALGYDAARVAMDTIERSTDFSGPSLRKTLEQTKDFPGISGKITIDADHNATKSAVVLKIENNSAKYTSTVNP